MKKLIVFLFLVFSVSMALSGQSSTWIKPWSQFSLDIPQYRSLERNITTNENDFRFVSEWLNTSNFKNNSALSGHKTICIYKLKKYATGAEVREFIASQNGQLVDAQVLWLVWEKKHLSMKYGRRLIGLMANEFAPQDLSLVYIMNPEIFSALHPLNNRTSHYVFDVGSD